MRCPFCGSVLKAIRSRKNTYVGGCENDSCPLVFRTKEMFNNREDAIFMIEDVLKFAKMESNK